MSEQTQLYAVRWAHGYYGGELDFTTWHGVVERENTTACGHRVPKAEELRALEVEDVTKTRCGQCLRRHEVREALKVGV